jgi:hypothetical protein
MRLHMSANLILNIWIGGKLLNQGNVVVRHFHNFPLFMARKPIAYAMSIVFSKQRLHFRSTFLDSYRPNASHVVLDTNKLWSLDLPQQILVFLGNTTKEVEPPSEELSFIWIIQRPRSFAGVGLLRIIDLKRLIFYVRNGTHGTISGVKYLRCSQ